MKRNRVVFVAASAVLALVAILATSALYVPYREKLPEGVVDWNEGWIRTDVSVPLKKGIPIGQAVVNARRVGVMKAQAASLRLAMRLPLDSSKRLNAFEALRVRVKGVVAGGEVVSEKRDGGVYYLSYKVPINGVKGIVSEVSRVIPPPPPPKPKKLVAAKEKESPSSAEKNEKGERKIMNLASFSSVIVDGTAAGVKPALRARIVDPDGAEVYGPSTVKPDVIKERSLASYMTPRSGASHVSLPWMSREGLGLFPIAMITAPGILLAQARPESGRKRGGAESFAVTAKAAGGKLKSDIVVTRKTARRLRELDAKTGALSKGRVIVVVRADVGGVESRYGNTLERELLLAAR